MLAPTEEPTFTAEAEESTTVARSRITKRFTQGVKDVTQVAVEALAVAASITESVPYLGAVSSALTKIIAVFNELETLEADWGSAKDDLDSIQGAVNQIKDDFQTVGQGQTALPHKLQSLFLDLETQLRSAMNKLDPSKLESKRLSWKGLKKVVKRDDLAAEVARCRRDIGRARERFQLGISINHYIVSTRLESKMDERMAGPRGDSEPVLSLLLPNGPASYHLPPAPAIFHGRDKEVGKIVELATNNSPGRVAILGAAGIGKTSIALSVLHHPSIQEVYPQNRFFVICEAYTSADGLVLGILNSLGLVSASAGISAPSELLLGTLRSMTLILCLDHLEAPWDADTEPVEGLLVQLVDIPGLTLLVTARGANRPRGIAWTKPLLPVIEAFSLDAATQTWDDISDTYDEFAADLCIRVRCLPLAVTLLAHLAESESPGALLDRWESDKTEIMRRSHGEENRLNSLPYSIELSLSSPRLAAHDNARTFLSLICLLPQGIPMARLAIFEERFGEMISRMRHCVSLLQQCSLIYSTDKWIRVHPTIRDHINSQRPLPHSFHPDLADIYCALIRDDLPKDVKARKRFLDETVSPELQNIEFILRLCMKSTRPPHDLDRFLWAVMDYVWLFGELSLLNEFELLEPAKDFAHAHRSPLYAQVLRQMAQLQMFADVKEAETLFHAALDEDSKSGDVLGQAEDWHGMGMARVRLGQVTAAETALQNARKLHADAGDDLGQAYDWMAIVVARAAAGDIDTAQGAVHEALRLHETIGDRIGQANSLNAQGVLHYCSGDYPKAEKALRAALKLHRKAGARLSQANDLSTLGSLYAQLDRLEEAEDAVSEALELHEKVEDRLGQASDLRLQGGLYRRRGKGEEAERRIQMALWLSRKIGDVLGQIACHNALGGLYEQLGRADEAKSQLKRANKLDSESTGIGQVGSPDGPSLDLKLLGKLYFRVGRLDLAREGDVFNFMPDIEPYEHDL